MAQYLPLSQASVLSKQLNRSSRFPTSRPPSAYPTMC